MKTDYIFSLVLFVFERVLEGRTFIAVYRLPGGGCVDTSVTRHEYIPIVSAVTSMSRTVTAASALDDLQEGLLSDLAVILYSNN